MHRRKLCVWISPVQYRCCLFSMEISFIMARKNKFSLDFSPLVSLTGVTTIPDLVIFWTENRFLLEHYLILTSVDHFYENQLEIPQVLKPVKGYRDIEGWAGM